MLKHTTTDSTCEALGRFQPVGGLSLKRKAGRRKRPPAGIAARDACSPGVRGGLKPIGEAVAKVVNDVLALRSLDHPCKSEGVGVRDGGGE